MLALRPDLVRTELIADDAAAEHPLYELLPTPPSHVPASGVLARASKGSAREGRAPRGDARRAARRRAAARPRRAAGAVIVDAHLHAYRSAAIGREEKSGYPIHEYGDGAAPVFSERDGSVADALEALVEAGASYAARARGVHRARGCRSRRGGSGRRSPRSPSTPMRSWRATSGCARCERRRRSCCRSCARIPP